jgi:hypothetical protein
VLTTWEPTFTEADLTATSFSSVTEPETVEDTFVVRSTVGAAGGVARSSLSGFWQETKFKNIKTASINDTHFFAVEIAFINEVLIRYVVLGFILSSYNINILRRN